MKISQEQVDEFRRIMNGAITVLAPDFKPGDPLELSDDQLRLAAGALGKSGTSREVEAYVLLEHKKWHKEPIRKKMLADLLRVVRRELELLEFFHKDSKLQTELPLPSHIKVLDCDTGRPDKTIPIDVFINQLRAVSDASVFKR